MMAFRLGRFTAASSLDPFLVKNEIKIEIFELIVDGEMKAVSGTSQYLTLTVHIECIGLAHGQAGNDAFSLEGVKFRFDLVEHEILLLEACWAGDKKDFDEGIFLRYWIVNIAWLLAVTPLLFNSHHEFLKVYCHQFPFILEVRFVSGPLGKIHRGVTENTHLAKIRRPFFHTFRRQ